MIIDAHCHIGEDVVFDQKTSEEELLANFRRYGVDGGIVQPYIPRPYIADTKAIHDRIHSLAMKHPGRIFGLASINPHFTCRDYEEEAERCVNELCFVGLKITPIGQAVAPSSRDGMHVFEVARKLGVPVMVHTGMGIPFADPIQILPCAARFSDVPIIMAHCGANFYTRQAIYVAQTFQNVFMEPSGADIEATNEILKAVGPKRVMFSSDVTLQTPTALAKFRSLLSGDDLEQTLWKTANEVFGLRI
jgi:uncharacterized protein